MYSHSLLKSKKLNSCLKIVFYNVILISKKKKKKKIIIKICYNTKKECTEMINMRKLILLVILSITTVSCGLLDPKLWDEARERRRERGVKCYEKRSGYIYCVDRDGNRVY